MLAPFYFMFVRLRMSGNIFNMPPPLWFGTALLDNISIPASRLLFWKNLGLSLYIILRPPR